MSFWILVIENFSPKKLINYLFQQGELITIFFLCLVLYETLRHIWRSCIKRALRCIFRAYAILFFDYDFLFFILLFYFLTFIVGCHQHWNFCVKKKSNFTCIWNFYDDTNYNFSWPFFFDQRLILARPPNGKQNSVLSVLSTWKLT